MIIGAGVFDVSANALYLLAVHGGLLSIVAVLVSLYPVSTVLCSMVVLGERLRPPQVAGVGAALVAVVLITAWVSGSTDQSSACARSDSSCMPADGACLHRGAEEPVGALAGGLGRCTSPDPRCAADGPRATVWSLAEGDTDARAGIDRRALDVDRCDQRRHDSLARADDARLGTDILEQNRELVAAEACGAVRWAQGFTDAGGR